MGNKITTKSTELSRAILDYDLNKVKDLVSKGANVNFINEDNFTLLMFSYKKEDIFSYLLYNGISMDTIFHKNAFGDDIISIVEKDGSPVVFLILKIFLEKRMSILGKHMDDLENILSKWSITNNSEIIEFYIKMHRKFVSENDYKNLGYLVKRAPTFGHSFIFYTSNKFSFLDNSIFENVRRGDAINYTRMIKCTYLKPEVFCGMLILEILIKDGYLFSYDHVVFVAPRFLTVKKVNRYDCGVIILLESR